MAKNIVVCCDGTGNEFVADNNSNVVKLYSTLIINADQRAYYHPGVGTMGARPRLTVSSKNNGAVWSVSVSEAVCSTRLAGLTSS